MSIKRGAGIFWLFGRDKSGAVLHHAQHKISRYKRKKHRKHILAELRSRPELGAGNVHIPYNIHRFNIHSFKTHGNEGIKALVWYTFILAVLYLAYFAVYLSKPAFRIVMNSGLIAVDLILIIIAFAVAYAMYYRKPWAYSLGIGWYFIMIIYAILFTCMLGESRYGISRDFFVLVSVLVALLNGMVIWYMHKRKDYFLKHHYQNTGHADRMFIYMLISFWVILLLISSTIAIKFYKDTKQSADSIIAELKQAGMGSLENGKAVCDSKNNNSGGGNSSNDRDVCYLVLAVVHKDTGLCAGIESDFHRFSCYQACAG